MLNATLISNKDFSFSVGFNIGKNNNKLISYPGLESSPYATRYRIGQPLNMMYVYKYIGVDAMTGLYAFEDYNKDGSVKSITSAIPGTNGDDRYIGIDMTPKYNGGLSPRFRYKTYSLSLGFNFINQMGRHPYATVYAGNMENIIYDKEFFDNQWKNPGDNKIYARSMLSTPPSFRNSDRAYFSNPYFRLNNIAFSYSLPAKLVRKSGMQSCDFSINVQNIFTLSKYGFDPEIGNGGTYNPMPRTVLGRLSFNF
jgi:hypothetical protein